MTAKRKEAIWGGKEKSPGLHGTKNLTARKEKEETVLRGTGHEGVLEREGFLWPGAKKKKRDHVLHLPGRRAEGKGRGGKNREIISVKGVVRKGQRSGRTRRGEGKKRKCWGGEGAFCIKLHPIWVLRGWARGRKSITTSTFFKWKRKEKVGRLLRSTKRKERGTVHPLMAVSLLKKKVGS